MNASFIDLKQLLEEKLLHVSQKTPLIVVYLHNKNAVLGALAQLLHINLADILLGKASTQQSDILVLSFSDEQKARQMFEKIPENWDIEEKKERVHAQLWLQGRLEAENTYADLQAFHLEEQPQTTDV